MKTTFRLRQLLLSIPFSLTVLPALSQTKAQVFDGQTPITWLGLDFTQAKFIGAPVDYGKADEVNNERISHFFTRSWNYLWQWYISLHQFQILEVFIIEMFKNNETLFLIEDDTKITTVSENNYPEWYNSSITNSKLVIHILQPIKDDVNYESGDIIL